MSVDSEMWINFVQFEHFNKENWLWSGKYIGIGFIAK